MHSSDEDFAGLENLVLVKMFYCVELRILLKNKFT
jgi:hypothetical protein